jgi:hypothetical protein
VWDWQAVRFAEGTNPSIILDAIGARESHVLAWDATENQGFALAESFFNSGREWVIEEWLGEHADKAQIGDGGESFGGLFLGEGDKTAHNHSACAHGGFNAQDFAFEFVSEERA